MLNWLKKNKYPKYFVHSEYWIYSPKTVVPPQDLVLGRMMRQNAIDPSAEPVLGPSEGLLFSDIRLHIALALKEKNPSCFRPDLFSQYIVPTKEILEQLALAQSFVKIRYLSTIKLNDDRHLSFMPYLAESMAYFSSSQVIFDSVAEQLMSFSDFRDRLKEEPEMKSADANIVIGWESNDKTGHAVTRGMQKCGMPELITGEAITDQRNILCEVLLEVARKLWIERQYPTSYDIPLHGDHFLAEMHPLNNKTIEIRIARRRELE